MATDIFLNGSNKRLQTTNHSDTISFHINMTSHTPNFENTSTQTLVTKYIGNSLSNNVGPPKQDYKS